MKRKYQWPVVMVISGLAYSAYVFYDFTTERLPVLEAKHQQQESQLAAKNTELRRLRHFSDNIESVKLSLRELNLQLEAALESMPRNYDLSGLLRKLSVIGFNSGIGVSSFKPGASSRKDGEFYETLGVSFNLSGAFTQILSFFDQALRLKRIIRIEKVTVRALAGGPAVGKTPAVGTQAEVSAKLYRFID